MIFLFINKRNWKHPGPILDVGVNSAASVASLGYETHLCVGAGEESDTEADLKEFYGITPPPDLRIHRIARLKVGSSALSVSIFLRAGQLARELARRDDVCVITREATCLAWLLAMRRNRRTRIFYEAHDFYPDLSWRTNRVPFRDRRVGWIERRMLPRIDGVICIARGQESLYQQNFPGLASCTLFLGTKPFPPADIERSRAQRTIVYVGHLHQQKGREMLMSAVPELGRSGVRTAFWGGTEEGIARMRQQLGAAVEYADFVPFRAPKQLHVSLAREASIGAVLLQDTFYNRHLTCPVKALDYLSHGLPIIGSDLPSVRDVVADAGVFIKPDDLRGFVRETLRILDNADVYAAAADHARKRAEELSWENRARKLVEFVTSVPSKMRE